MSYTFLPTPQKSDLDLVFAEHIADELSSLHLVTEQPAMSLEGLPAFQFVADGRRFLVTVEEVTLEYGPARLLEGGLF